MNSVNLKNKPLLKWIIYNPLKVSIFTFISFFIIVAVISFQRYYLIKESRKGEIDRNLGIVQLKIYQFIDECRYASLNFALAMPRNKKSEIEATAKQLIKEFPYFKALELAPNGVIDYVYPYEENKKAIGLDILKHDKYRKAEAEETINRKTIYFQGPYSFIEGGRGIVGRIPLFINNKFWGFSIVVVKFDDFIRQIGLNSKLPSYYHYGFSKLNPVNNNEEFFIDGHQKFKDKLNISVHIPQGNWKIYLVDTRGIFTDFQFISSGLLGLLLCIVSATVLYYFLQNQKKLQLVLHNQTRLLQDAIQTYKTIFDHAAIGIIRVDTISGKILEANVFLRDLLGYDELDIKDKKIKSLIYENDLIDEKLYFRQMRGENLAGYSYICRYLKKNNELVWVNAIVSSLWDKEQVVKQHLILVHDIGKQKAYEQELIHSRKHIEDLINSLEGVVWEANMNEGFRCTYISNKIEDLLGYTAEETMLNSINIDSRVYSEDILRVRTYYRTELLKKSKHSLEYRLVAKDNSIKWIRDIVTIHPNLENPEFLRGIMIDITHVKEVEDSLHKSYSLLADQNKRLLNFSYIISHNLRSHSSNIEGILSLFKFAETDEERTHYIEILERLTKSLNLTLLNLNKIADVNSHINIEREELKISEYINDIIRVLSSQIVGSNAIIENQISLDVVILFNKAYLESVLLNLLTNALKYANKNCQAHIVFKGENIADGYQLSVIDNGVGIDLEKFGDRVFGFSQTFHGNEDARGMGLFLVKTQLEALGASISVQSTVGVGTVFTIIFRK